MAVVNSMMRRDQVDVQYTGVKVRVEIKAGPLVLDEDWTCNLVTAGISEDCKSGKSS